MTDIQIGYIMIGIIGYIVLIPKTQKKHITRALIHSGSTKTVVDGEVVEVSNRTNKPVQPIRHEPHKVTDWHYLIMGLAAGLFIASQVVA